MIRYRFFVAAFLLVLFSAARLTSQAQATRTFVLDNGLIECQVVIAHERLDSDRLTLRDAGGDLHPSVRTDADFALDIMWSDWQAPGKENNADNPVVLTKKDFVFTGADSAGGPEDMKELHLFFKGPQRGLALRLTYRLGRQDFYIRRSVELCDSTRQGHLLREIRSSDCLLSGNAEVVKKGGFGQPAALRTRGCGAFFGSEYPASQNSLERENGSLRLRCGESLGELIGEHWLGASPVVEAVTPKSTLKMWFWKYVDDIRVAPARPYTLYNSWYDLRSSEYPKIPSANVMNEENIMRIIGLLGRNMIFRHGIHLDAFVLDDGWDVYESDWVLRTAQFPHGLRCIADTLAKTQTDLGLWIGPSGGYSFRDRRITWMKDHGYEIVDDQLCLAGTKYSALFRKRVEDFARTSGVSYFKWDGIQFACNQTGHGHPTDLYSRRAVLGSLIEKCAAVRSINPRTYLNITSGTWLSPWWVKYANQIWMDYDDYGYADLPSLSPRDAAMTFRDAGLYTDFTTKDLWFPMANVMTHGIIKGTLEQLGGAEEPLDRFTNETLLYVARGVSMWELYVSPDILSEGEWDAISRSIEWARDRFPILATTTMVGGNPLSGEPYAYVHWKEDRGIIAARNPRVEPKSLRVKLSASDGLDPGAGALVLERVYPVRHIEPTLYRAGSIITLPLGSYETAVYEIYPLSSASLPLLAGVDFEADQPEGGRYSLRCYGAHSMPIVLNPSSVENVTSGPTTLEPQRLAIHWPRVETPAKVLMDVEPAIPDTCRFHFRIYGSARNAALCVLIQSSPGPAADSMPSVTSSLDGREVRPSIRTQKGLWGWYSFAVEPGEHRVSFALHGGKSFSAWKGRATAYLVCDQIRQGVDLTFAIHGAPAERILPPTQTERGTVHRFVPLAVQEIGISRAK